jgi:hypothetical protein
MLVKKTVVLVKEAGKGPIMVTPDTRVLEEVLDGDLKDTKLEVAHRVLQSFHHLGVDIMDVMDATFQQPSLF